MSNPIDILVGCKIEHFVGDKKVASPAFKQKTTIHAPMNEDACKKAGVAPQDCYATYNDKDDNGYLISGIDTVSVPSQSLWGAPPTVLDPASINHAGFIQTQNAEAEFSKSLSAYLHDVKLDASFTGSATHTYPSYVAEYGVRLSYDGKGFKPLKHDEVLAKGAMAVTVILRDEHKDGDIDQVKVYGNSPEGDFQIDYDSRNFRTAKIFGGQYVGSTYGVAVKQNAEVHADSHFMIKAGIFFAGQAFGLESGHE